MFEKILLATDGSIHAQKALTYARDLAESSGGEVIVVHAFEPISGLWGDSIQDEQIKKRITAGEEITGQAVQELEKAGIKVDTEVLEGPPADAILRVVDARQPDLVVMGTRGRSEPTSLLLGSVSHRVMAHSKIPVMVVRTEG